jgi:lipopolysaccharide transport system ATP-binding protein
MESTQSVATPERPEPPTAPNQEKHVVLALENVSKRFCRDLKRSLFYGLQDIGRELVGLSQPPDTLRKNEFWAVQDVNFELRSGDALGFLGINGCGKTTLMRIIAGLIKPTTGRVIVRGRLAPLLSLGAGFNPVLTGRENIFANMAVLGLSYDEIEERFDSVVEFSEIGYAIDAPVQTYSSGMVARLGFACAINTQPDILLLDEVLAVGDINFRRKCLEKLFEMRATGMSLLIVHHSPSILLNIAETGLYLQRGKVLDQGAIGPVAQRYQRDIMGEQIDNNVEDPEAEEAEASSEMEITEVRVESESGDIITSGDDAAIIAKIRVLKPIQQLNFTVTVIRYPAMEEASADGKPHQVLRIMSRRDGGSVANVKPGEYEVRVDLPFFGLLGGIYRVSFKATRPIRARLASRSTRFIIVCKETVPPGSYLQRREWSVTSPEGARLHTEKFENTIESVEDILE